MMINGEKKIKMSSSKEEIKIKNAKNNTKRIELEKELNIQRNQKSKKKEQDMKKNQLNYYHEIAKNNTNLLMNNPTIKEIIRITSNESVFDQLKLKEGSKDLSKFLDNLPLKRVERINYKGIEIGNIRKDLQKNNKVNINKEKGKKLAKSIFQKRKRQGSVNFIPVLTVDNLSSYKNYYQQPKKITKEFSTGNLLVSCNECWLKKYKHKSRLNSKNNSKNKDNKYFNDFSEIKNFNHNYNLDSARNQANKYKKSFDLGIKKDKQINEKKLANANSINKNFLNKYYDSNDNIDYFPKKTLTQKPSYYKYNNGKDFQILSNKENKNESSNKYKGQSCVSSTNIKNKNKNGYKSENNGKNIIRINNKKENNIYNNNETDAIKAIKKKDIIKNNTLNEPNYFLMEITRKK